MVNLSFKRLWSGMVLFLFAQAFCFYVKGKEDQSELLNLLRSGIDNSIRDAQFKCVYSYSLYVVETREEAERFDTTNGKRLLHATGSLIKSKTTTFESFKKDQCDTKRDFYLSDHITVTNANWSARYVKMGIDVPHRTLFISKSEKTNSGLPLLDQVYAPIICPLTVSGSRSYPNFFDIYDVLFSQAPDTTTIDVSQGKETTDITIHFGDPDSKKADNILTLSNGYPYPAVISRRETVDRSPKAPSRCHIVQTFDLVDTGKSLFLPKKICCADGPIVFDDFGDDAVGKWLVRIWESEDLGKELPKESDFFIHLVDEGTNFLGLSPEIESEMKKNPPKYFDINSYSPDDYYRSFKVILILLLTNATEYLLPALIFLGVVLIGGGLYYRRKWTEKNRTGGVS